MTEADAQEEDESNASSDDEDECDESSSVEGRRRDSSSASDDELEYEETADAAAAGRRDEFAYHELVQLVDDMVLADGVLGDNLLGKQSLKEQLVNTRDFIFQLVLACMVKTETEEEAEEQVEIPVDVPAEDEVQAVDGHEEVDEGEEADEGEEEAGEEKRAGGASRPKTPKPLSAYRRADILTEQLMYVVEQLADLKRTAVRHAGAAAETAESVRAQVENMRSNWIDYNKKAQAQRSSKSKLEKEQVEITSNWMTEYVGRAGEQALARNSTTSDAHFVLNEWWALAALCNNAGMCLQVFPAPRALLSIAFAQDQYLLSLVGLCLDANTRGSLSVELAAEQLNGGNYYVEKRMTEVNKDGQKGDNVIVEIDSEISDVHSLVVGLQCCAQPE